MFLDPYGGHYLFEAFNLKNYSFFEYYLFFQIKDEQILRLYFLMKSNVRYVAALKGIEHLAKL